MTAPSRLDAEPARPLGRAFHRLWAASTISNLGDGIDTAALPLLAAALTRDPLLFSGVAAASRLPWLLFSLHAGAIVDRVDRRRLMVGANVVRFGLMGLLGVAVLGGWASIWLLYAVSFALGVAETLFDNASQTLLPSLVARDQLETANGRLFAAEIAANQFAGPPLGGFLFAVTASLPILLDAGTFLVSAGLLVGITTARRRPPPVERTTLRQEIGTGLRWLHRHRVLRALALMLGLANGMAMAVMAIFPLFALEILDVGEVGFGLLLTAGAAGSVLGSLLSRRIVAGVGRGRALLVAVVAFSVPSLVQGASSDPYVVGAAQAVFGGAAVVWNVITVSMRQTIIPDELLGRVNSVYRFLGWGSMPLGSLLGGVLAAAFGLRAPFFVAGAVLLVALVPFARVVNQDSVEAARTAAGED